MAQHFMLCLRLSIKWTEPRQNKINITKLSLPCEREVAAHSADGGIENSLGHRTQGCFGVFRFLLGGSTIVQLPLARKRNSVPFLEVLQRVEICYFDFFYTLGTAFYAVPFFTLY